MKSVAQVSLRYSLLGEAPTGVAEPVQLKLVNPDLALLEKGEDGLFRFRDPATQQAPADPNITLVNGFVEGSNVNAVKELTDLIAINRQYEMQVKMMKKADENAQAANPDFIRAMIRD